MQWVFKRLVLGVLGVMKSLEVFEQLLLGLGNCLCVHVHVRVRGAEAGVVAG